MVLSYRTKGIISIEYNMLTHKYLMKTPLEFKKQGSGDIGNVEE